MRLEPIALFARYYDVPFFLNYIKLTFFRSTLCKTSRAVLWLLRHKHLFETHFINDCLNETADHFGTTKERLETWEENRNTRLTNVNLRRHLKARCQAKKFKIREAAKSIRDRREIQQRRAWTRCSEVAHIRQQLATGRLNRR